MGSERPPLEATLRAARNAGRKLLVPYVTGGMSDEWTEVLAAMASAGADAVEVGIPFSDPVMDGPTIQATSAQALGRGATPSSILSELRPVDVDVPLVAMTYYNLIFHAGEARFAQWLADAGVSAAIVPDVPLEEVGPWESAAAAASVETVLLAAPTASDERLARICERARGFVYGVSLLGVTGERSSLSESATSVAKRLKAVTDKPVIVGIGISNPDQARAVCEAGADGVVVASAIMRRLLDGEGADAAADAVSALRSALDRG
ncbi:MAG: tryptophan synthase subunit alpha [Acidimicrobiales bacterium]